MFNKLFYILMRDNNKLLFHEFICADGARIKNQTPPLTYVRF